MQPQDRPEGLATALRRDHGVARRQATSERAERLRLPRQGLVRRAVGFHLQTPKPYVLEMVDPLGPRMCRAVGTAGTTTLTKKEDSTSHLDCESHHLDLRVVKKLLWLVPIRPDLRYISKELSRIFLSPIAHAFARLKHAIRNRKVVEAYRLAIRPRATNSVQATFEVTFGSLLYYEEIHGRMHHHCGKRRDSPLLACMVLRRSQTLRFEFRH